MKAKTRIILLALPILLVPAMVRLGTFLVEKPPKPGEAPFGVSRVSIERNPMMNVDFLLIPLGARSRYTFISLSFSMELPNGKTKEDMEKRISEVRGFIYDTLKEDFANIEGIPPLQEVKDGICRAVRTALSGSRVVDVYISQFLAL